MSFGTVTLKILVAWGLPCGNGIETGSWWSKAKGTKNIHGNCFNWGNNRYSHPDTCVFDLLER